MSVSLIHWYESVRTRMVENLTPIGLPASQAILSDLNIEIHPPNKQGKREV